MDERRPKPSSAAEPARKDAHGPDASNPLSAEASAALAAASAALAAFEEPPAAHGGATLDHASPGPPKLVDLFPRSRAAAPYETFYGLTGAPFDSSPDPRFQFHWPSRDRVLRELTTAIGRRPGTILLIGDRGAGKTTFCRALAARLGRRTLVSIGGATAGARERVVTVLVDFGVLSRADASSSRLRHAPMAELASMLRGFLASLAALQAVALVVIDDADRLAPDVLAELQVLSDIASGHKLLQVILAGAPELLQNAGLEGWDSRIGLRAALAPLASGDVADYVGHRLAVAGRTASLFDEGAIARIHALSRGIPGDVNSVCDRALAAGHLASAHSIDANIVDRVVPDETAPAELAVAPWRPGRMSVAGLLVALMLAGAAGAGWMLREPLVRVLARWHVLPER